MSVFVSKFDSRSGTERHAYDETTRQYVSQRIGTNLGGSKPYTTGFVGANSGVFTCSKRPGVMWNDVISALAQDCCIGIGPSLSVIHNQNTGLLAIADYDAEVCRIWTKEEKLEMALMHTEAYMECCPGMRTAEGEEPRPVFVYSEPAETVCKRVKCCPHCSSASLKSVDTSAAFQMVCNNCGKTITESELVVKSSFKVGFHLNGIQARDDAGETVDVEKSGPILTTSDHLFVRSIALAMWSKHDSSPAKAFFKIADRRISIKKAPIIIDGNIEGKMNVSKGSVSVELQDGSRLESGTHAVASERINGTFKMRVEMPRAVPPFPGSSVADDIIDKAVLGSSSTAFNGMMRCAFVPKILQKCTCANPELGIEECYICGSSVALGQTYKIPDQSRRYIPTAYIMSDLTVREIHDEFDRFDFRIKDGGSGHTVGETIVGDIKDVMTDANVFCSACLTVVEVDGKGAVSKVRCANSIDSLEYYFKVKQTSSVVGILEVGDVSMEVFDRRFSKMKSILQKTFTYLPDDTPLSPFTKPHKYAHMVQEYSLDTVACDIATGIVPAQKTVRKGKSVVRAVPQLPSQNDDFQKLLTHNDSRKLNASDERYRVIKEILLFYWGKDGGKHSHGVYTEETLIDVTVSTKEPAWGKMGKGKRPVSIAQPFYWVKIKNNRRCANAAHCATPGHKHLLRMPAHLKPGESKEKYCQKCDPKAWGIHSQQTPTFMKIDLKNGVPHVTLGCHCRRKGTRKRYAHSPPRMLG